MSGFMFCVGACISCGSVFSFNPDRVPSSSALTGVREPICQDCMARINQVRAGNGLPAFEILPDAYEPVECA
jgi:hypothetical protein